MPQILRPTIDFAGSFTDNRQDRVKVTFDVRFTDAEIAGGSPRSLQDGFPGANRMTLPPSHSYSARVVLKVIRMVPVFIVKGQQPPPPPDPVDLQIFNVGVKIPKSGNITSLAHKFIYQVQVLQETIWDTLFADITLYSTFRLGFSDPYFITSPVASNNTNYLGLEGINLQSPQDNGIEIPI